jgi:hypothetical protein
LPRPALCRARNYDFFSIKTNTYAVAYLFNNAPLTIVKQGAKKAFQGDVSR